jgi:ribosomal protein S18 acetylase RimI-like enzyme
MRIAAAVLEPAISDVRKLMREYSLLPGVVQCLDDFERELASLPGAYAPPSGCLLLAVENMPGNAGEAIGCAAIRSLEEDVCEMKRLYVRPAFRRNGAARELVEGLIQEARLIGYRRMVLDTLPSMQAAHKLYRTLGFREIPPYAKNPVPGALFFQLTLR